MTSSSTASSEYIPPIFLREKEKYTLLHKACSNGNAKFFGHHVGSVVRVAPKTVGDFQNIIKIMNASNILYHKYMLPDRKVYGVYLHSAAICNQLTAREVFFELIKDYPIVNVFQIYDENTNKKTEQMLVYVCRGKAGKKICEATELLGHPIRIEDSGKQKWPPCGRCQGYGHSDRHCQGLPWCSKCDGRHLTKDCRVHLRNIRQDTDSETEPCTSSIVTQKPPPAEELRKETSTLLPEIKQLMAFAEKLGDTLHTRASTSEEGSIDDIPDNETGENEPPTFQHTGLERLRLCVDMMQNMEAATSVNQLLETFLKSVGQLQSLFPPTMDKSNDS